MRILVVTLCRNESRMIEWFMRHYSFADEVHVWHNDCDGNCNAIAPPYKQGEYPLTHIARNYHYRTDGLRDDLHAFIKGNHHKFQHGFDWCIAVDMDEFLYHPRGVRTYLEECTAKGVMLPRVAGFNMVADGFPPEMMLRTMKGPPNSPEPIVLSMTDLVTHGVPDPNFGKRCVFDTRLDMQYGAGCHPHDTRVNGAIIAPTAELLDAGWVRGGDLSEPELKLLHYRWWSEDDAAAKASRIVLSDYNKANQLGTHGQTDPEHERQAYRDAKAARVRVI